MKTLARGAVLGAAFGLATAGIETWFGASMMMRLGMPPQPVHTAEAALLEIGLGVVLGVLLAPALLLSRGAIIHVLTLAAVWLVLERTVAPDPTAVRVWATGPVGAVVLVAFGVLLARWWPVVAWTLGAVVLASAIVTPVVVHRLRAQGEVPVAGRADARPDAPDVLLVVLDTVRAQNVSAYGYARETTPYLERLAGEGALFLDATAPSTWSLPSHASLFTGWYPSGHKAHGEHRMLDTELPTLAEVFAKAGYETRCFTANPHISDGFGLTRGFDWSDRAWQQGSAGRSFMFIYRALDLLGFSAPDKGGAQVAENFEQWIESRPVSGRPAFAFVNFLEAHFPYHQVPRAFLARFTERSPRELRRISLEAFGAQFGRELSPEEVERAVGPVRDMYDAGILYSDHLLSRLVEALRRAGRLDNTILVVLADHGEMLGEHGDFGHGAAMYEPDVRVPLLVRFPPRVPAGARVAEPVSTLGVFATILDLAGLELPGRVHVGSLTPAIDDKPAGAPVIAERFVTGQTGGAKGPLLMRDRRYRTYRSGTKKLVVSSKGETFLFDLVLDPRETRDRAASMPDELARLQQELETWMQALGLPPIDAALDVATAPEIDPAVRERLEALGYTD